MKAVGVDVDGLILACWLKVDVAVSRALVEDGTGEVTVNVGVKDSVDEGCV